MTIKDISGVWYTKRPPEKRLLLLYTSMVGEPAVGRIINSRVVSANRHYSCLPADTIESWQLIDNGTCKGALAALQMALAQVMTNLCNKIRRNKLRFALVFSLAVNVMLFAMYIQRTAEQRMAADQTAEAMYRLQAQNDSLQMVHFRYEKY